MLKIEKRILSQKLDVLNPLKLGQQVGFYKYPALKVKLLDLLTGFYLMALDGHFSFLCWARRISLLTGELISKQAIAKKIHHKQLAFSKLLLGQALKEQLYSSFKGDCFSRANSCLFTVFNRVLLQDSTSLQLPDKLVAYYPGNKVAGKRRAIAKIQSTYDVKNESYVALELGPYNRNDASAAADILEKMQKGDLLIRDLGYYVLKVLASIAGKGAFFLSRFRYGTLVYELENEKKLDLLDAIANKPYWDQQVIIGEKERIPVRLIAIQLPETVAAERRRKAHKNRDKRLNHSKRYLQLLGYTFLITNVCKQTWTVAQVAQAYRLRWRIEIIFKCWKSHFCIAALVKKGSINPLTVQIIIYYMLVFITCFLTQCYHYFLQKVFQRTNQYLSLSKFSQFITESISEILQVDNWEILIEQVAYYCVYEKHNKRKNYNQLINYNGMEVITIYE